MSNKLSIESLSNGIKFHTEAVSEVAIQLVSDMPTRVSNFIAKYEEFINLTIDRYEDNSLVFKLGASSVKEIARICDIMSEDIDVIDLEILSTEGN
jgi:predicted HTH domain antitoxin